MRKFNEKKPSKLQRVPRFESLEFRRLLANDISTCTNLRHLPLELDVTPNNAPELSGKSATTIAAEGEGPVFGTTTLTATVPPDTGTVPPDFVPPVSTVLPNDVFPTLVFSPPFDQPIDAGAWGFSDRTLTTGGIQNTTGAIPPTYTINNLPGGGTVGNPIDNGNGNGNGNGSPIIISVENDFSGYEGDTPRFQVRSNTAVPFSIIVSLSYSSPPINGATQAVDYTPTMSVTISAYSTFTVVNIPFLTDGQIESTERFNVKISSLSVSPTVATFDPNRSISGTIYDRPPVVNPSVRSIEIVGGEGQENGTSGTVTFYVYASNAGANAPTVSVRYQTVETPGSAKSGLDFTPKSGTITFSPTQSMATITVPIIDDSIVETAEYLQVVLTVITSNTDLRAGVGVGTIIDNDGPVKIYVDDANTVKEGESNRFAVWIDNPTRNVSGVLRTRSGSATQPSDYYSGDYPFTIPLGTRYAYVSIPTKLNSDPPELNVEDYVVLLENVVGNVSYAKGNAIGKIIEATPTLTVYPTGRSEAEEGNTAGNAIWVLFEVSRDYTYPISVPYHTEDRTAFAVSDYYGISGTVEFRKGINDPETGTDFQKFIKVWTRPDFVPEIPIREELAFVVGTPVNAAPQPNQQLYSLYINDDDVVPVLSIENGQAEEGKPVPFVIKLDRMPLSGSVSFDLVTEDGDAKDGIGEPDMDYTPQIPSSLNRITLTQLTTTVTVSTNNDGIVEADEKFFLKATNPIGATLGNARATGTILDNDSSIDVSIGETQEFEGNNGYDPSNKLIFTISLTRTGKPITNAIAFEYYTLPDSPTLPNGNPNPFYATPVIDYDPRQVSGTLTVLPGQNSASFAVPIFGDQIPELNEVMYGVINSLRIVPNSVYNAGTISLNLNRRYAKGTIIDDDQQMPGTIGFDFERILEQETNCICTSADTPPIAATVSAKDGGLVASPAGFDSYLELRKGATDSVNQLQSFVIKQNPGTNVPDSYSVSIKIGNRDVTSVGFGGAQGDAGGKLAFTVPIDLTSFSTGFYDAKITIGASKNVLGGALIYESSRQFKVKVVNTNNSEYTSDWWNPRVERLYPQKVFGDGNISNPNFNAGVLYVRGDQTGWIFQGPELTPPDGLFATLTRLPSGEFEMRLKHGEIKTFSSAGMLIRESDRNGNMSYYYYIDADLDGVADELKKVTDIFGRATYYNYTGGFLSEIRDFADRATSFTIVGNRLTKITGPDPDGPDPRVAPFANFVYQFTSQGGFINVTDAESVQTQFNFNQFGRVSKIQLADGSIWTYQYMKDQSTISFGSGTPLIPGNMESVVTNPRGFKTRYKTDKFGLPLSIVYADGYSETYTRNKHGQPLTYVVPSAYAGINTSIYTYDTKFNLVKFESPEVGVENIEYDSVYSLPIRVTSTFDPEQVLTRDARGNVIQVKTKSRNTSVGIAANTQNRGSANAPYSNPIDRFDVDNDGLVSNADYQAVSDYINNLMYGIRIEEGNDGRPLYPDVNGDSSIDMFDAFALTSVPPKELVESYTYTPSGSGIPAGMLSGYTNASNEFYGLEYYSFTNAAAGLPKRYYRLDGSTTYNLATYTYNPDLNVSSVTDVYGRTTSYAYDRLDLLTDVREVAADGVSTTQPRTQYQYSIMGHLTQIVDPLGQITTLAYNPATRVQSIALSGGTDATRNYRYRYDAMGNLIDQADALNRITTFEYDQRDRLSKVIPPSMTNSPAASIEYKYNVAGLLSSVKDLLGTTTTYSYTNVGDLSKVSVPNPNSTSQPIEYLRSYSSPGVLSSTTDPLGATISYITDDYGRLAAINYPMMEPVGARPKETIAYDNAGRSLASTDRTGEFQLSTIDAIGRVTKVESMDKDRTGPATRPTYLISVPQLLNNRLTQNTTLPDGRVIKTTSDLRDRTVAVEMPKFNGEAGVISSSYQYDILDRVTSETNMSGLTTQYQYNRIDQAKQVSLTNPNSSIPDTTYFDYDAAGRLKQVKDANTATTNYYYDDWDRLTTMIEPDPDGSGALLPNTSTWTYNLANRSIVRTGSDNNTETSRFDALGRTTSQTSGDGGTTNYVYDAASQLTQLTDPLLNVTKLDLRCDGPDNARRASGPRDPILYLFCRRLAHQHDRSYKQSNRNHLQHRFATASRDLERDQRQFCQNSHLRIRQLVSHQKDFGWSGWPDRLDLQHRWLG